MLNKKQPSEKPGQDKLAALIAGRILGWQRRSADRLNARARRYEKAAQLRWLWLFCVLAAAAIVCSTLITSRKSPMPHAGKAIIPVHIGQSSEGVPSGIVKPTDSLNHKIQKHGNDH